MLEKYVCKIYGKKQVPSVHDARMKIFWKNFTKDQRVTDLSLLPPCKSSLLRHIQRANYVARIWRQSSRPMMQIDTPTLHGWKQDLSVDWVHEPYPDNINELSVNEDLFQIQDYGDSHESSDKDND